MTTPKAISRAPIDRLFDSANMTCTVCDRPAGTCDCWVQCKCGHTFPKDGTCSNPIHGLEKAAAIQAEAIMQSVIITMRDKYPEPMKAASGGFRKTLQAVILREASSQIIAYLEVEDEITKKALAALRQIANGAAFPKKIAAAALPEKYIKKSSD